MDRWAYAKAHKFGGGKTSLLTTAPSPVDDVFQALQQLLPSARVSLAKDWSKLGVSYATFDRLGDMDGAVRFWIAAKLCELGWEPFGVQGSAIALRKAIRQ